jgi:peptidoglycan/LPS O-acetylase OafA/YrhL
MPDAMSDDQAPALEAPVKGPEAAAGPRPHLKFLEGLRALAALMVYVNHAYAQSWNPILGRVPDFPLSIVRYSLITGHFAVTIFIALSGFCLALPVISSGGVLRDGFGGFIKRRARRILPPYYAALALCLALIYTIIGQPSGSLWDVPIIVDTQAIVSHLLLVQDIFRTGRINYVFWSIAVEWQIYFLFPLLLWLARRYGFVTATAIFLVLGYLLSLPFADTRFGRANPHFIGVFALGVLGAFIAFSKAEAFERLRRFHHYGTVGVLALLGTLALVVRNGLEIPKTVAAFYDGGIAIFAFGTLVACSQAPLGFSARFLSLPPLVKLGTFSYSFYLLHAPVLQILWQFVTEPLGLSYAQTFTALMTVGLAIVLIASYAFFWAFERPFLSTAAKSRVS